MITSTEPKKIVTEVNAAPNQNEREVSNNNNLFTSVLSMFCGAICKDVEIVPRPKECASVHATLTEINMNGFSKDVCRSMVSMLDQDRSGKLGFQEFKKLWEAIRQWKNVWLMYDTDRSGTFSGFELRDALNSAGYRVNNKILTILMHRYGNKVGQLEFDDFMMAAIKLKTMLDIFNAKDTTSKNLASFTMEEWLENTLYS